MASGSKDRSGPIEYRKLMAQKRKKILENVLTKSYKPTSVAKVDLEAATTRIYTREDNYRAYRMFSIMDVDHGGSISRRELNRVLMGDQYQTAIIHYEHPDTGIVWSLDEYHNVIVDSVDPDSPLFDDPTLVRGLRLLRINDRIIKNTDPKALEHLYQYTLMLHDEPVEMEFEEPIIIITDYSCLLNIEVSGEEYVIKLPVGAVYNIDDFEGKVAETFSHVDPIKWITLTVDRVKRQVFLRSDEFRFKLLFKTGKDIHLSCRYALGFGSEDSHSHHEHHGLPLVLDLNLGITEQQLTILMDELFVKFDKQGSGEFDFESFRNFYITYLDTAESREELKKYAEYRFRDLEKEAKYAELVELDKIKREKRRLLKEKNKDIVAYQRKLGMERTAVGPDGIQRRVKSIVLEHQRRVFEAQEAKKKKRGYARMEEERRLKAAAEDEASVASLDKSIMSDWTPERIEAKRLKDERKAALKDRRQRVRDQKKAQAAKRLKIMRKIRDANEKLNRHEKRDRKKAHERIKYDYMTTELREALRTGIKDSIKVGTTGGDGKVAFEISMKSVIANPAFIFNSAVYSGKFEPDDVEFDSTPNSILNPVVSRYFLIRDPVKRNWEFDSTTRHPAFFTAEFERITLRHSSLGLGCCRVIHKQRQEGVDFRKQRGIPTAKPLDPMEDNPKLARKPKVIFRVGEHIKTSDGLIARVTVHSISLVNLPSFRILEPNSPFVQFACGDYKFSTEINAHAGSESHWTDLEWIFRVYEGTVIEFSVFTGSAMINALVGRLSIASDDFVKLPITENGDLQINAQLRSSANKFVGQIQINFLVELGQVWEWHVFNHMKEVKAHDKLAKFKRRLLRKTAGKEPSDVDYPIHIEIYNISLFDLTPVHFMSKNSPDIHLDCGSFLRSTGPKDHAGDTAHWPELNWHAHMLSGKANLIFIVKSGMTTIGRFAINGDDLCMIPRSKTGKFMLTGALSHDGINRGILRANCQLMRSKSGRNWKRDPVAIQDANNPLDILQVPFLGNTGPVLSPTKISAARGTILALAGSTASEPNLYADEDSEELPARVVVKQIIAADLNPAHLLRKNCPQVILRCGEFKASTEVMTHYKHGIRWNDLNWAFPIARGLAVEVTVSSVIGKSSTSIGTVSISATEMAQWVKNRHGDSVIKKHITNGIIVTGGVQLLVRISKERESSLLTFFPDLMGPYVRAQEKSGAVLRDFEPVDSQNRALYPTEKMTMAKVAEQTKLAFPFHMNLVKITLTDMKSAHFLTKNSPFVNAACGLWATSTKVRRFAGKNAEWDGLQWGFFVNDKDFLRMTVWSQDVCIGSAHITSQELIESPANSADISELFKYLELDGLIRGKIKIEFIKESYSPAEQKTSNIVRNQLLTPPLLATIYTIAVFDLRPVHPFSRNVPVVQGKCGLKRWSTQPNPKPGDTKWEETMWGVFFDVGSTFTMTVISGSVVIGSITIAPEELTRLPQDIEGLTVFDSFIRLGDRMDDTGRIQFTCRLEAHVEPDEEDLDSDDDLMFQFDTKNSMLGLPRQVVPRVSRANLVAVSLTNLVPMHKVFANSPFVVIACDGWNARSDPLKYAGSSAKWLDLPWTFQLRRLSVISLLAGSGDRIFGKFSVTTRDIFEIEPDESGYTLVTGTIIDETGAINGGLKLVFQITPLEFHADEDEFDNFEVDGAVYNVLTPIELPVSMLVDRIFISGLEKLHTIASNSPMVEIRSGALVHRTDPASRAGSTAEWFDLGWKMILRYDVHAFNITVKSGGVVAGVLTMAVADIIALPRTSRGYIKIEGPIVDGSKSRGKISIAAKLAKLHGKDAGEASTMLHTLRPDESVDLGDVAAAGHTILGQLVVLTISASDMAQKIGLYRNSPQVFLTVGSEEYTSEVARNSGMTASWEKLDWMPAPLFAGKKLVASVSSEGELIGSLSIEVDQILMLPRDAFDSVTIAGDLRDGAVVKGNIQLRCKLQPFDGDLLETKQFLLDKIQKHSGSQLEHSHTHTTGENNAEGDVPRPLSASTPTPMFTRVVVHEIVISEMKSVHMIASNSPQVSIHCGGWHASTEVLHATGKTAKWVNQSFAFTMRKMAYAKFSVSSRGVFIGSTVASTREILECEQTPNGVTILTRELENEAEFAGYIHIYLRFGTQGEDIPVKKAGDEYVNPIQVNVGQATIRSLGVISHDISTLNFPVKIAVRRLALIDLAPMHTFAPNSPFGVITCADWRMKTSVAALAGQSAEWSDLGTFVLYDDRAMFRVEARSGTIFVGKLAVSIAQIIASPRDKDGTIVISGHLKRDEGVTGSVQISIVVMPHGLSTTEESTDRASKDLRVRNDPLSRVLAKDEFVGILNVRVVTVMDLSRLIGAISLNGNTNEWDGASKTTAVVAGMAVVGPLGESWRDIKLRGQNSLQINVISDQNRQIVGSISISVEEIIKIPVDSDGTLTIVGDLVLGNAHKGRISMGCNITLSLPERFLSVGSIEQATSSPGPISNTRERTLISQLPSPNSQLLLPIRAHNPTSPIPAMSSPNRAASPVEFPQAALEALLGRSVTSPIGVGTRDPFHIPVANPPDSRAPSRPTSSISGIERTVSPTGFDDFGDYQITIPSFSGIILPPVERPFMVRIHSIAVFDLPNLHSVTQNSPQIYLSFGEWRAKTSEAYRGGSSAEWINVNVSFCVPIDEDGKLNVWTVLVRSGSTIAGACMISIDELSEIPRKGNGFVTIVKNLKHEGQLRGTVRIELSLESLRSEYLGGDDSSIGKSSIATIETPAISQLVGKLSVRMITVIELAAFSGAIKAIASNGKWTGSTMAAPIISQMAALSELTWEDIPLFDNSPFRIEFVSDSNERVIGTVSLSSAVVLRLPRNEHGNLTISAELFAPRWQQHNGKQTHQSTASFEQSLKPIGKVNMECKLDVISPNFKGLSPSVPISPSPSRASTPGTRAVTPVLGLGGDDMTSAVSWSQMSASNTFSSAIDINSFLPLPLKILAIKVFDLPSMTGIIPNSPIVYLSFGNWKAKTVRADNAGSDAEWLGMDFSLKITDSSSLLAVVVRCADFIVGSFAVSVEELLRTPRQRNNRSLISGFIRNNGSIRGRIQMEIELGADKLDTIFEGSKSADYSVDSDSISSRPATTRPPEFSNKSSVMDASSESVRLRTGGALEASRSLISGTIDIGQVLPVNAKIAAAQVFDLPQGTLQGKYSPLLYFSFGDWKSRTNVAVGAGSHAEWSELNIPFTIDDANEPFNVIVRSEACIYGSLTLTVSELINSQRQASGLHIINSLIRNEGSMKGRIQLVLDFGRIFSVLAGDGSLSSDHSVDQSVESNMSSSQSLQSSDSAKRLGFLDELSPSYSTNSIATPLSRKFDTSRSLNSGTIEVAPLLPIYPRIFSIQLFDLPQLHSVYINSPVVYLSCGDWKARTSIAENAGSQAEWFDVNLPFTVSDGSAVLHVIARSGSKIFGSLSLTIKELVNCPRQRSGKSLVMSYLRNEGSIQGRIQLEIDMGLQDPELLVSPSKSEMTEGNSSAFSLDSTDDRLGRITPLSARSNASDGFNSARSTKSETSIPGNAGEEYIVHIVDILCRDIRNAQNNKRVAPVLRLDVGSLKANLKATTFAGDTAQWVDLTQSFSCKTKSSIRLSLHSGTSLIGSDLFRGKEILESPFDDNGLIHLTRDLKKQDEMTANLLISLKIEDDRSIDSGIDSWGVAANSSVYEGAESVTDSISLEKAVTISPADYLQSLLQPAPESAQESGFSSPPTRPKSSRGIDSIDSSPKELFGDRQRGEKRRKVNDINSEGYLDDRSQDGSESTHNGYLDSSSGGTGTESHSSCTMESSSFSGNDSEGLDNQSIDISQSRFIISQDSDSIANSDGYIGTGSIVTGLGERGSASASVDGDDESILDGTSTISVLSAGVSVIESSVDDSNGYIEEGSTLSLNKLESRSRARFDSMASSASHSSIQSRNSASTSKGSTSSRDVRSDGYLEEGSILSISQLDNSRGLFSAGKIMSETASVVSLDSRDSDSSGSIDNTRSSVNSNGYFGDGSIVSNLESRSSQRQNFNQSIPARTTFSMVSSSIGYQTSRLESIQSDGLTNYDGYLEDGSILTKPSQRMSEGGVVIPYSPDESSRTPQYSNSTYSRDTSPSRSVSSSQSEWTSSAESGSTWYSEDSSSLSVSSHRTVTSDSSSSTSKYTTSGYIQDKDKRIGSNLSTTGYLDDEDSQVSPRPESLYSIPVTSRSSSASSIRSELSKSSRASKSSTIASWSTSNSLSYQSSRSFSASSRSSDISLSTDFSSGESSEMLTARTDSTDASYSSYATDICDPYGDRLGNEQSNPGAWTAVNSVISSMSIHQIRTMLQKSHAEVFCFRPSPTFSVSDAIRSFAVDKVAWLVTEVLDSFVAAEVGYDYLHQSRLEGKDPLEQMVGVDPMFYIPRVTVEKIMLLAGTRALSLLIAKQYDDDEGDSDTVGDEIGRSDQASQAPKRSNVPQEVPQDSVKGIEMTKSLPMTPGNKQEIVPKFKKRAGITLSTVTNLIAAPEKEPEIELKDGEIASDYCFKVEGFAPVPIKAKITFLDILGVDVSCIDKRIFPRRPYLTVCKPYGNWAGRTKDVFVSDKEHRLLTKGDMTFNWYNLSETEEWQPFGMRIGQVLVFDLHDGGSGLIIAKAKVQYEAILEKKRDCDDRIAFPVMFTIANEYGGGKLTALARVFIDLSVMTYIRPPKDPEYWEKHRVHHWKTYPLSPICTGVVRRTYGLIALEYDRQKIIHPAFFGFQIHWKGHQTDESRFIHPIFKGYSLAKKPVSKEQAEENIKSLTYATDPNPYRWDPDAASQGKCPVCADGLPGCPRCFMLPNTSSGVKSTPAAFAFDYDEMMAEAREMQQLAIKIKSMNKRKEEVESLLAQQKKKSSANRVQIHTNLTNYRSLNMYREYVMNLFAVYVKIMPTGGIRKLFMDPSDSVFNLYNMVVSHIGVGNTRNRMLVLPTSAGLFELTNNTQGADEFTNADTSGQDKLEMYGMKYKRGIVILLYFARYYPYAVNTFVDSFISKNSTLKLAPSLPVYDNALSRVPSDLLHDPMQSTLRGIVTRQFAKQQLEQKLRLQAMGLEYKTSKERQIAKAIIASRGNQAEQEKERRAAERRIKSQVRHIPLERRGEAIRILMEREFNKKGHITPEEKELLLKSEAHYKAKLERRNRLIGPGDDDDSSVLSLSNIKIGNDGEDGSNKGEDEDAEADSSDDSGEEDVELEDEEDNEDIESLMDSDDESDEEDEDGAELNDETDENEYETSFSPSRGQTPVSPASDAGRSSSFSTSDGSSVSRVSSAMSSESGSSWSRPSSGYSDTASSSEYSSSRSSSRLSGSSSGWSSARSSLSGSDYGGSETYRSNYSDESSRMQTGSYISEEEVGAMGYLGRAQLKRADLMEGEGDVIIPYRPGDSGSLMYTDESTSMSASVTTFSSSSQISYPDPRNLSYLGYGINDPGSRLSSARSDISRSTVMTRSEYSSTENVSTEYSRTSSARSNGTQSESSSEPSTARRSVDGDSLGEYSSSAGSRFDSRSFYGYSGFLSAELPPAVPIIAAESGWITSPTPASTRPSTGTSSGSSRPATGSSQYSSESGYSSHSSYSRSSYSSSRTPRSQSSYSSAPSTARSEFSDIGEDAETKATKQSSYFGFSGFIPSETDGPDIINDDNLHEAHDISAPNSGRSTRSTGAMLTSTSLQKLSDGAGMMNKSSRSSHEDVSSVHGSARSSKSAGGTRTPGSARSVVSRGGGVDLPPLSARSTGSVGSEGERLSQTASQHRGGLSSRLSRIVGSARDAADEEAARRTSKSEEDEETDETMRSRSNSFKGGLSARLSGSYSKK